jgi:hypothetical protein
MFRATGSWKETQKYFGCGLSLSIDGRLHFGQSLCSKGNPAEIGRATLWGRQGRGNTVA